SWNILTTELQLCYLAVANGNAIESHPPQYVDFVRAEQKMLEGEAGARLSDHWKSVLPADVPSLDLGHGRSRSGGERLIGTTHYFAVPRTLAQKIRDFAVAQQLTPFNVLLAAWAALLHRYTGQSQVIIGTPTSV